MERCFAQLKQWRAVATRYDKLAGRYLAGVTIASLLLWLRHAESSDTPQAEGSATGCVELLVVGRVMVARLLAVCRFRW
ncbi:hypothetical protein GCM10027187_21510 [Streptosporangium sandarakinum]